MSAHSRLDRRTFLKTSALACAPLFAGRLWAEELQRFGLRFAIASSLYGNLPLAQVLPEVPRTGTRCLDLWPKKWGGQREEVEAIGHERFAGMLEQAGVKVGISTRFDLGPFKLREEIPFLKKFGGDTLVVGYPTGPVGLQGAALRAALKELVEAMKPHLAAAGEAGLTIAFENHGGSTLESPDSIRWLAELAQGQPLGIALAPYHLDQNPDLIAGLIRDLGPKLTLFYAWQYGMGCMKPMPANEELMQFPGRGNLDFSPLLQALKDIRFQGWTEVFMHHTPRGEPLYPTAPPMTEDVIAAHRFLTARLAQLA